MVVPILSHYTSALFGFIPTLLTGNPFFWFLTYGVSVGITAVAKPQLIANVGQTQFLLGRLLNNAIGCLYGWLILYFISKFLANGRRMFYVRRKYGTSAYARVLAVVVTIISIILLIIFELVDGLFGNFATVYQTLFTLLWGIVFLILTFGSRRWIHSAETLPEAIGSEQAKAITIQSFCHTFLALAVAIVFYHLALFFREIGLPLITPNGDDFWVIFIAMTGVVGLFVVLPVIFITSRAKEFARRRAEQT